MYGSMRATGPREQLTEVGHPAGDRAADVVRVVVLEVGGAHHVASEDPVAESRGEPLDLVFDGLGAILRRPVGDVAVRPAGVLAGGRSGGVEKARLDDDREGPLGVLSVPDSGLGLGDLRKRAAHVDGGGVEAARGQTTGWGRRAPSRS